MEATLQAKPAAKKFNPEQIEAIGHFQGPALVTACPGSGKTTVITERGATLIEKHGIQPQNILCITFTNKAANEMKERILARVGEGAKKMHISTFHSLCVSILRKASSKTGIDSNFTIFDTDDQKALIKKIAGSRGVARTDPQIYQIADAANSFREKLVSLEDYAQMANVDHVDVTIIQEYLKKLKEYNAIDFSGLLYETYRLMKENPNVADILSRAFQFIQVDEGQDTNKVQIEIVFLLSKHGNVVVVGDFNQSIYKFRGADPENLNVFKDHFGNVKEYILPRNYRSHYEILECAERLIRNNPNAHETRLVCERGEGATVEYAKNHDPEEEANWLVYMIQRIMSQEQLKYDDFAILYRVNSQSRAPELALKQAGIPYRLVGGFSFFNRREIKTAIAYLSLFVNPTDVMSFTRAIGEPARGVGEASQEKIETYAYKNGQNLLEACTSADSIPRLPQKTKNAVKMFANAFASSAKENGLGGIARALFERSGYEAYIGQLTAKEQNKSTNRSENLREFISSIEMYGRSNPNATLSDFIQYVKLLSSQDVDDNTPAVTMSTQHASKGTEYKVVFVIGAEHGYSPHFMSIEEGNEDEERRLFFVAVTRAKHGLYVSSCSVRPTWGKGGYKEISRRPSPFIREMGIA